jgi:hypothetical protein
VLLYGPPAAGKLTVARCLAERHGLKVLDNHASVDPALRLFSFGEAGFGALVEEIRVALISAAARAGIDIVTTLVYAHGEDEEHVRKLTEATTRHGGVVDYVQLCPPASVLEERVASPSRATTQKLKDVATLRLVLDRHDLATPIHREDLRIDNRALTPDEVADRIADALALPVP